MMPALQVPYAMAPITRRIFKPDWGHLVSHDRPFADGLSGSLEFTIKAVTPLVVGGVRRPARKKDQDGATADTPGQVFPFLLETRDGAGAYAIPPSTLQGMVRSILEVATFGRLGPFIDNKRFGIRDFARSAQPFYGDRLNPIETDDRGKKFSKPRVRTGWLKCDNFRSKENRKFFFRPCQMARIDYKYLAPEVNWSLPGNAAGRYDQRKSQPLVTGLYTEVDESAHVSGNGVRVWFRDAFPSQSDSDNRVELREGNIVLTGHVPNNTNRKHREFFFYETPEQRARPDRELRGFDRIFAEFEAIHAPDDGREANPNWVYYRDRGYPVRPLLGKTTVAEATAENRKSFADGGWMPIFYLEDTIRKGEIATFGLAFLFKIAHNRTTHDLLANSIDDHLVPEGKMPEALDLPSLIFGVASAEAEGKAAHGGLKRRAWFDFAVMSQENLPAAPVLYSHHPVVLVSPKPNYYPVYVRQPDAELGKARLLSGGTYATYTVTREIAEKTAPNGQQYAYHRAVRRPELAGVKLWPATGKQTADTGSFARNRAMSSELAAIAPGVSFTGRMYFHNLRPAELGLLIWALSYGEPKRTDAYRHRLGMAKPYGCGEVEIALGTLDVRPNAATDAPCAARCLEAAREAMNAFCRANGGEFDWEDSAQVRALRQAAAFEGNTFTGYQTENGYTNYVDAKRAGAFRSGLGFSADGSNEFKPSRDRL